MTRVPFHPLLFALFPVLSLFTQNFGQLPFLEWLQPAVLILGLAIILWTGANRWLRDRAKSAVLTTIFLILFFSFGRVLDAISYELYSLQLIRQYGYLLEGSFGSTLWGGFCIVVFAGACFLVVKSSSDFLVVNQFLNVTALALITILFANLAYARLNDRAVYDYVDTWHKGIASPDTASDASASSIERPDIYYIILDGYGRSDILSTLYHFDNSAFYSFLTGEGFYVAAASHSNYIQTHLSLASSLNSLYLNDLRTEVGDQSSNRLPLGAMIEDNSLFRDLHSLGYKVITFSTGIPLADISTSDVYMAPPAAFDAFQNAFLDTTPFPYFLDLPIMKSQYELHRDRVLYSVEHLQETTKIPGPKLVFCHIVAPHPPFVFGANGESVQPDRSFDLLDGSAYTSRTSEEDYDRGYRSQLVFITKRVEVTIEQILAQSPKPPVIIIQGDHGPGSRLDWTSSKNTDLPERLSILNAYYFPDMDYHQLYPSITPVNTFRVVLSHYFGITRGLLPDLSYYSTYSQPYAFEDVTNQVAGPSKQ